MKKNILIILLIIFLGILLTMFTGCKNYCLIFFGSGGDCVYNDYNYDLLGELATIVPSYDDNELTIKNYFGQDVALSENGDTIVVGAPQQGIDNSGGVYVFTKTDQVLNEDFNVLIPTSSTFSENNFAGKSVSITDDGNIIVYGVPEMDGEGVNEYDRGAVFVFEKDIDGNWIEEQKLVSSDIENFDKFGSTVRISGDGNKIIVGCVENVNTPTPKYNVYLFEKVADTWTEVHIFDIVDFEYGSDAIFSISDDGSIIALSDPKATDNNEGVVYVYVEDGVGGYDDYILSMGEDVVIDDCNFGNRVDVTGNGEFIFVSNSQSSNSEQSAVYVYSLIDTADGDDWANVATIPYDVRIRSISASDDGKYVVIGGQEIADAYVSSLEPNSDTGNYEWLHYQEFTVALEDAEPGECVRISSDSSTIAISDIRSTSTKKPGTVFVYDRLLESEIE